MNTKNSDCSQKVKSQKALFVKSYQLKRWSLKVFEAICFVLFLACLITAPAKDVVEKVPTNAPASLQQNRNPNASEPAKPVLNVTLPASWARAMLPPDGEIIDHVIKKDVWKENKEPFFRNEMVEFTLGKAIRAKKGDRKNQKSLTPSVVFDDGFITLQGGWRAHKHVPWYYLQNDFFDGTVVGSACIVDVGGKPIVDASISADWRESLLVKLSGGIGDIIEAILMDVVAKKLENEIEKKAPKEISRKVDSFLKENNLPVEVKNRLYADITKAGMRFRLYDSPLKVRQVQVPSFGFKLKKTGGGEGEFSGNGPKVDLNAKIALAEDKVMMKLSMSAKEIKGNGTKGANSQTLTLFEIPPGEVFVDVVGGTDVQLLDNCKMKGHNPMLLSSQFGKFEITGDTKSKRDIPEKTGVRLVEPKSIYVVTVKRK